MNGGSTWSDPIAKHRLPMWYFAVVAIVTGVGAVARVPSISVLCGDAHSAVEARKRAASLELIKNFGVIKAIEGQSIENVLYSGWRNYC